ncbi:pentatricopeptide repeat-containing protein At3g51320 isoform X2 [Carica papaya]|uniref:pentatricopeptide repeat-containing protein At3g51320 isoform X2 n=1 Tax=Carica papaya TaxID=3649 RepID=UPI000B8C6F96|nr:pentatricopeptide repeat-containing protein At3g51320 isoform X2 [Carica papaya]XP_021908144.1 pentatricopeptide repeat-containing protein At3g51320 isoform X2 [Carica papaya]
MNGKSSVRQFFRFNSKLFFSPLPSISSSNAEDKTISICHSSLHLLNKCQNLRQLLQIQAHLIATGLFRNPSYAIRILKRSSLVADIDYTISIFQSVDKLYCVNTIIKAYSISSVPQQGLVFYFEMLRNGFIPDSYTFVSLFGSCVKMGCIESGKKCHGQAIKNGVDQVLPVQNSLIHMYGCGGMVELAHKLFIEMSKRDVASWNSIVDGYARNGNLNAAHDLFDSMPERNIVSWNVMISAYLKGGNPGCALKLFREMVKTGLSGNHRTMACVLTACGRSARLKEGRSVHANITRTLLNSGIILDTTLIDMYSKCQKVVLAQRLFDKMAYKNQICWNAMILGHCIHGNPEDGLNLFADMVEQMRLRVAEGISPDVFTFIGVLCACARAGLLTEGRKYFSEMIDVFRIKPNFGHFWCMANLYTGAGLFQEAEEILRNMAGDDEDTVSESSMWANILSSCRFQGDVSLGEKIAKSLIDVEPENFSYYRLLLNVYAVAGRWEDVARVKEMMKEKRFGRMPGCGLVDLKEIVHDFTTGHTWQEKMEKVDREPAKRPAFL